MTTPAKIEPWQRLAASVIADEWIRNWSADTLSMRIDSISSIIAAHAPKETGIKPDTAQAARHGHRP